MIIHNELVLVIAHILNPEHIISYAEVVKHEEAFWHFSDRSAQTLWDAVNQLPGAANYEFLCRAIRFEVEPMTNPAFVYPDWKSNIDMALRESNCTVTKFFEVDAHEQWMSIIDRHLADTPALQIVRFYAVYHVAEIVQRDEEDCKDSRLEIDFAGELDIANMTLTSAKLEMDILRAMGRIGHVARAGEISAYLDPVGMSMGIRTSLDTLCTAGLIVSQDYGTMARFSLTERGQQAVHA